MIRGNPTFTIEIEECERGNIVRHERVSARGADVLGGTEIIEGTQGSQNLRDRTRRFVAGLLNGQYPPASANSSGD